VDRYVEALQSSSDAEDARREAWAQIRLAGVRAGTRRAEALRTLELMFRRGRPPELDGETRGHWLTPALPPPAQGLVRAATSAWMPWLGKRFEAAEQRGHNLVVADARLAIRALWPSYSPASLGDGRLAVFPFGTRLDPAERAPRLEVLKIDYDRPENPPLLVRNILDELVEVVPGAYLGRMLVRRSRNAPYRASGWFALHKPG
jgi:hypothetical protein